MTINFPSSPSDLQIETIDGRQYIWVNAKQRWESFGGFSQATFTKPTDPVNGETYFDPATGGIEVWDEANSIWVAAASSGGSPLSSDPKYNEVILHLKGDNLNDSGPRNLTANQSTFVTGGNDVGNSKWGGGSLGFTGPGFQYTTTTYGYSLQGSFTVEMWVKPLSRPSAGNTNGMFFWGNSGSNDWRFQIDHQDTGELTVYYQLVSGTSGTIYSSTILPLNSWSHIAVTKTEDAIFIFVNGGLKGINLTDIDWGNASFVDTHTFYVGQSRQGGTNNQFTGYIEDFRLTAGARYTQGFLAPIVQSPSRAPYITTPIGADGYTEVVQPLTSSPQTFLFTGIPATATEIKIQAQPVTASSGITGVRVGPSTGILTTNYWFSRTDVSNGAVGSYGTTTNSGWDNYPIPAGQPSILTMTLKKGGSTNVWSMSGTSGSVGSNHFTTMLGSIDVGGSLERIQFYDTGGTGLTYGPTPGSDPRIRIYYR